MIKRLIAWLYEKYVFVPAVRKMIEAETVYVVRPIDAPVQDNMRLH